MEFSAERIDLGTVEFSPRLLRCVPSPVAVRHRVIPIFESLDSLGVAVAEPVDLSVIDALVQELGRAVDLRIAEKAQLDDFIRRLYGSGQT